jgi:predicted GIY-YIG superfamily endonuclease
MTIRIKQFIVPNILGVVLGIYVLLRLFLSGVNKMADANDIEPWSFYIIQNKGYTYAGVSPDPVKRLRKHNGELSGGAKYTQSKGPGWTHVCLVHGFQTKIQALQFEWAVKHVPPRDSGGLFNRLKKLYIVFNKTNWTSKSPEASTVALQLEWKIPKPSILNELTLPLYITTLNSISLPQLK